jgi:inhibitor of KinA sporulation pathway (predicted exonuclease)
MAGVNEPAADLLAGAGHVIVLDVEATCWRNNLWTKKKETIELGAVRWTRKRTKKRREFQTFVRPVRIPKLSTFCIELTGIKQSDVDPAPTFPEALHAFLEWAQPLDEMLLATWSRYDLWQLDLDLEFHHLPKLDLPHVDIKKLATKIVGGKSFAATAKALGLEVGEDRHRAIADARLTAEILDRLLERKNQRAT